jgi:hypothetical protein
MPDLGLINRGIRGAHGFGETDPSISSGSTMTATNAGDFAADLLQEQQMARRRFNEWLEPATPARRSPDHHPDPARLPRRRRRHRGGGAPEAGIGQQVRPRARHRTRPPRQSDGPPAQIAGSYGGLALVYSAACDGFDIMFRWVPGGLDGFVDRVVPELQRGNLFRREYEGRTLRENLGLPRPETASSASQKASRDACFRSPFLRARVRAVPRCALLCCARNGPDFPSLGSRPRCAGASCGID